jgi:hypothetical protein
MGAAAVQLGVFFYALLATFVSSAMSMNRRENRKSSGKMVLAGWGLFAFSTSVGVMLAVLAGAMALGIVSEDAIQLSF